MRAKATTHEDRRQQQPLLTSKTKYGNVAPGLSSGRWTNTCLARIAASFRVSRSPSIKHFLQSWFVINTSSGNGISRQRLHPCVCLEKTTGVVCSSKILRLIDRQNKVRRNVRHDSTDGTNLLAPFDSMGNGRIAPISRYSRFASQVYLTACYRVQLAAFHNLRASQVN